MSIPVCRPDAWITIKEARSFNGPTRFHVCVSAVNRKGRIMDRETAGRDSLALLLWAYGVAVDHMEKSK